MHPVPSTFGTDAFRGTVETVAEGFGLHVHETESPFRLVVSVA